MKIFIKNMVCQGTKHFILLELERLGLTFSTFGWNEIELKENLSIAEIRKLDHSLREMGLEARFRRSL